MPAGASLLEIALATTAAASAGVSIYSAVEQSKERDKQIKTQEMATKLRDTQASISRTREMMQIAAHKYAQDEQIGNANMSLELQELQEDQEANHAELAASIFSDAASGAEGIASGFRFNRNNGGI